MAFTYTRGGFPFQRYAQTLVFMLRQMSSADRAFQTVTGRSDLVCEPTTAAGCLPGPSRRHQRRVKGLLLCPQGWEVKHPPIPLPSHIQAHLSAAGVPSPYLFPAWPCVSLYLQFYRRNTKSLLEKTLLVQAAVRQVITMPVIKHG